MALTVGRTFCLLAIFSIIIKTNQAHGDEYDEGDNIKLYVNKVGPYYNPHETYHYYQLPVCRPQKIEHRSLSLGEVLDGDRMAKSLYKIHFRENLDKTILCSLKMSAEDVTQMQNAIEDLYYFEFVVDDLPLRNFVGRLEEGPLVPHTHHTFLWTHYHFTFEYNERQIISGNITVSDAIELVLDQSKLPFEVTYTYSVSWNPTKVKYENRLDRSKAGRFFPRSLEIHWLSVINSLVLVFLLVGFVAVILIRIVRRDLSRYNEEKAVEDTDEYGWKILHSDVFRFPHRKMLFCALLGAGSQLLSVCLLIIVFALVGGFNVHRHGAVNSAGCFLYALTSFVSGYVSCRLYKQMGEGYLWVRCVHLTSCLFAVPFFILWSVQNSVAWAYHSTQALPFSTIILLMAVWLFIGYPLTVLGGVFGKNSAVDFDAPCKAKNIPREIPYIPWYRSWAVQYLIGGFLPFSAISVELYYVFSTLWGREQYTLYGILGLTFCILLCVTAAVSIALTYFQLSAEDHQWWWRSVFSAGFTSFFVFFYALFYYFRRTNMSGLLQTVEFFTWTLLTCYAFFLALGTVSFFASLQFVRYIYRSVKMD